MLPKRNTYLLVLWLLQASNTRLIAITAMPAGQGDAPVAGGLDRCTTRRGVVHTLVSANLVQHRVTTAGGEA